MKNSTKIILLILFSPICLCEAQCYQPNVAKGNAALEKGNYAEAYDFYSKATKCPDASKFNNGMEAKENLKKCLPVLTIEGKQIFEISVGPEAGERTFNVQSKRIRMWIIDGSHRRQNIIIDPKQITNNQFHAQWEANLNNTPRDLNIRLFSVDGVKEIDAYITIHQAAGGLRVNGKEDKEYHSTWEGNALRFDITGIPAGEQYQLIGIDTSWIAIQKHSRHFFAFIKPNKTTNSRSNRITISSNNQNLTITITQKGSLGTNNSKSMARVPTNGLRVSPSATIPIVVRSKTRHTDLNSSQNTNTYIKGFLNAQGEVIALGSNLVLYNRYCENYPLRQSGIYPINNNCFLQVTLDTSYSQKIGLSDYTNKYYTATLYSYNNKKLNKLAPYKFNTGYKHKDICIHRFNNDDFSIWYELETEKTLYKNENDITDITFRDVRFQCELYRFDGHLYFKDYARDYPSVYEDGIVLTDKWTNYLKKKDKEWYEHYLIRRNGTRVILPKDVKIHSIKDGMIRISKESKHTSEGVNLREYGFCDLNGKIFIKPQYFDAYDFSEGLAVVAPPKRLFCCIDKNGNEVTSGKYAFRMMDFSDGLSMVYGGDYPSIPTFIDRNGKIRLSLDSYTFPLHHSIYYEHYKLYKFSDGVSIAQERGYSKYCLINKNGEKIIDSLFDDVTIMHNGLAGIYRKKHNGVGGMWGIINNKGDIVVPPRCANPPLFSPDGSVRLIYGDCVLTIDSLGTVFNGANVDGIEFYPSSDSLLIFSVNSIFGFFDNTLGIISIPPQFNNALPFSENLAAVQVGSKWGFIDGTGKQIIPTVFEKIKPFHNGLAEVVIEGKTYNIDRNGIIQ